MDLRDASASKNGGNMGVQKFAFWMYVSAVIIDAIGTVCSLFEPFNA